jgi:hypothetical protein
MRKPYPIVLWGWILGVGPWVGGSRMDAAAHVRSVEVDGA